MADPTTKQADPDQDLYATPEEAMARAEEIGCIGAHVHEVDGTIVYMPCDQMADYERLTGLAHTSAEDLELVEKQPISAAVERGLRNKVEEHNEKYGDNPKRRATYRMLAASWRRGVGAYKTNPESVRPGVTSADQWGYARVNAFLRALGRDRYASGRFDTDLLPEGHKYSTKMEKAVWSTAYVNDLPDSAFFFIGTGGEKDEDGKTTPRALRKLPYRNHLGEVDLPHLRNVLARLSQTDIPESDQESIRDKARSLLEEETRKGILLKAYESIDFTPPKGVAAEAEQGLKFRREGGGRKAGGTLVGVARARDLAARKPLTPDTIRRMVSFFARHEVYQRPAYNSDPSHPEYPGAGRVAWLLWGGDSGRRWAEKIRDQMNREDEVKKSEEQSAVQAYLSKSQTDTMADHFINDSLSGNTARFLIPISGGPRELLMAGAFLSKESAEWKSDDRPLRVPSNVVIEASVDASGEGYQVTDLLALNSVSMESIPYAERLSLLEDLFSEVDPSMARVSKSWPADSPEELTLACRAAVTATSARSLIVQDADSIFGDGRGVHHIALTGGYNEGSFGELMDYVPLHKGDTTKAIFVTGSPNPVEKARAQPLAGPDGATFNELYLSRLGLDRSEISIIYACPHRSDGGGTDGLNWQDYLEKQVESHPGVPLIALGKAASASLRRFDHVTLPHPRAVRRKGDRGEIQRKATALRKRIQDYSSPKYCPILKADEEKRIVYGIVLEPHTVDLQGDVLGLDTIEEAAHKYLTVSRTIGDGHSRKADAEVVESYLAPTDYELGGQSISKGTWIMGVRILDDAMWALVKTGDYTGFSIGGTGVRHEVEEEPDQ